jgi:hypothetical protein
MVQGWPDAIKCTLSGYGNIVFLLDTAAYIPDGLYYYTHQQGGRFLFNPDGTFNSRVSVAATVDCDNKSISELYAC